MPSFLNKPNSDFKKEYRNNIHSDYDKQLKILLDDLKSYSFIYEYVKDDFNELNPMELLSDLNRKVDFNDLYYMKLMEKYQYVIVTDDGDFDSHEITVLTENKNLLSKQ
jgi:predicted nucleic acid-binding protein